MPTKLPKRKVKIPRKIKKGLTYNTKDFVRVKLYGIDSGKTMKISSTIVDLAKLHHSLITKGINPKKNNAIQNSVHRIIFSKNPELRKFLEKYRVYRKKAEDKNKGKKRTPREARTSARNEARERALKESNMKTITMLKEMNNEKAVFNIFINQLKKEIIGYRGHSENPNDIHFVHYVLSKANAAHGELMNLRNHLLRKEHTLKK